MVFIVIFYLPTSHFWAYCYNMEFGTPCFCKCLVNFRDHFNGSSLTMVVFGRDGSTGDGLGAEGILPQLRSWKSMDPSIKQYLNTLHWSPSHHPYDHPQMSHNGQLAVPTQNKDMVDQSQDLIMSMWPK